MKIRIKGNALRYRLTRSDMATLEETGHLQEQTDFAGRSLIYELKKNEAGQMTAAFEDNKITLYMPVSMITELVSTERVGFDSKNGSLTLLVEKDFTCMDNPVDDQSDNYPNPLELKRD